MSDKAQQEHHEREGFFRAAKLTAAVTLLSRLFGMVRDMAIASLGATTETSVFVAAYRIPNLFRRLFGEGALSGAFVPVFTETAEREGQESANRLFANAHGLLAAFLTGVMLVIQLALVAWWWLQASHAQANGTPPWPWDRQLLVMLTVVMLPFMPAICVLALGSAALNCRGHFAFPSFAPIILNIVIILGAWVAAPLLFSDVIGQLYVIAGSVTVAGIAQYLVMLRVLRAMGLPLRPTLTPVQPGIRAMLVLMAPTVLGLSFPQLASLFEVVVIRWFSATDQQTTTTLLGHTLDLPLHKGAQVYVYCASQLYQFPMGVLAISLSVAVFPLLSRYAGRGDMANFRDSLNRAIRLSLVEGLAAGVGLFVLVEPITALIYQRRRFTAHDVQETAGVLMVYLVGMWAYCTYQIMVRAFYAIKEPRRPLKVIAVMAVAAMVMDLTLIWIPGMGAKAFGAATALSMSLTVAVLAVMLRRRLGRLGGRAIMLSAVRSLAACAVMAGVILALRWWLGPRPAWLVVLVCVPVGGLAFMLTAWLLRAPELREFLAGRREVAQPSRP